MKKLLLFSSWFLCVAQLIAAAIDGAEIERITGLKGTFNQEEGVFKVSQPRDDVNVRVDGWH